MVIYLFIRSKFFSVNNKGIECLGDSYSDVHKIITYYCYNLDDMAELGFSAAASGNWTVFCR